MNAEAQHKLIFQARLNVFYHEAAERFYTRFLGFTSYFSLVLSSAAFAAIGNLFPVWIGISKDTLVAIFTFVVTCMNGAILAFGMSYKASLHTGLKKKWIEVLRQAQQVDPDDPDTLEIVERRFYELNAEEPFSSKRRLDRAYRATSVSMGLKPHIDKV